MNKDTERFFKSRIEGSVVHEGRLLELSQLVSEDAKFLERILQNVDDSLKYKEYLPVYSLAAAAGAFGEGMDVKEKGWIKVDIKKTLNRKMFVAKVVGKSMEPLIPDGSYCVFSANVVGSRMNKIVLVQHNSIADLDTGGRYTIKKYTSKKKYAPDGTWEHEEITLLPINPAYAPIEIPNINEGEFMVIAEFITVLK